MSFFGFDTSGPQNSRRQHDQPPSQVYDFQDTYEGMGEYEEDDAFNSETFGVEEIGKNFDFGGSSGARRPVSGAQTRPNVSFAQAASAANDDEFMKDLWGDNTPDSANLAGGKTGKSSAVHSGTGTGSDVQSSAPSTASTEHKILSLQEIEAQLTAIDTTSARSQGPPQTGFYPGAPAGYGGFMLPQGYMPPGGQYGMPYPGQFMHMQPGYGQIPPQQMPGGYPGIPGRPMVPSVGQPPLGSSPQQAHAQAQAHAPAQTQVQPQVQPQPHPQQQPLFPNVNVSSGQEHHEQVPFQAHENVPKQGQSVVDSNASPITMQKPAAKSDLSHFPMLGSTVEKGSFSPQHPQIQTRSPIHGQDHATHGTQMRPVTNSGTPHGFSVEEQHRMARRQEKVAKIMKYSGVMNPKDKDFVTRIQLSQIVTEDPYNEDFYAQVYKVIHPRPALNALGGVPIAQEPNSIAQAYLDQSGHRLGGRFKRADVALQRMQQQVQKAVSVAKDRQKSTRSAREGVLGKISVGTGKKPRQQLVILSKAAQKAKDNENQDDDDDDDDLDKPPIQNKGRSPSMAAPSKPIKKYTKKDIMCILEEIINNLMSVESESRTSPEVDTTKLWESMHVLDHSSSSGDDESFVNPFIQCLNYAKALKILPRLFKFLTRDQILTVIALIMANLENLNVIKDGSYTTYENKIVPEQVSRLIDTYTLTLCKVLMNAVQDFKFNQILRLLSVLVQHNAVSFVSTTKIGLSIITTLLSRAELIRGEGSISATDLSEWTSCYDELFTALESRIAAIFPPMHGDTEHDYVWQFLATLSLGGKLSHQRIIVEEVRDEIFGVMSRAKAIDNSDLANLYKKQSMMNNLNMYLVVMGLVADENEIQELQT